MGGRTFTWTNRIGQRHGLRTGAGDVRMTENIGLRFAASYFRVIEEGASNSVRFAVGVVFPF